MRRFAGIGGLFLAGLLLAAPLEAQRPRGGPGGGPNLDQQMEQLTEQLELTEEQATQVREILEAQMAKRREMFGTGDRSGMRERMGQLNEETNAKMAEVLSEDQMAKYAEIQAERRQRRGPPPF